MGPRGFAFVDFEKSTDAEFALQNEKNLKIHSHAVDVDWCKEQKRCGNFNRKWTMDLDAETIASLPTMEVEAGKWQKIIPASLVFANLSELSKQHPVKRRNGARYLHSERRTKSSDDEEIGYPRKRFLNLR